MWRSNTAGTAIVVSSDDSDSEELPPFKFARYSISNLVAKLSITIITD